MEAAGYPGKPGHMKKDGKANSKNNVGTTDHPITSNHDAHPVQSVGSPVESWVFSTASCYHVTADREIMENYTSGNFGKVYDFVGNSMDVVGEGDVRIKLSDNATWILRDVKHIPRAGWNQISVGVLATKGYKFVFSDSVEVSTGDFSFNVPLDLNPPPNRVSYLSTSP